MRSDHSFVLFDFLKKKIMTFLKGLENKITGSVLVHNYFRLPPGKKTSNLTQIITFVETGDKELWDTMYH